MLRGPDRRHPRHGARRLSASLGLSQGFALGLEFEPELFGLGERGAQHFQTPAGCGEAVRIALVEVRIGKLGFDEQEVSTAFRTLLSGSSLD